MLLSITVPFYKKQLRLPSNHYLGRRTYFVTVCTENRAIFFRDLPTGHWLLEKLITTAEKSQFTLHAYCVMPDHLHFVSQASAETCHLTRFVDRFKQVTAYEFRKTRGLRLWQKRYYDHVLRPREAIEDAACYVWWNPVRQGLCAEPHTYPLSGSQTINWMQHATTAPQWQPPWKHL